MDLSTSPENSPRPLQLKEELGQQTSHRPVPLYTRQKRVRFQDQEAKTTIKNKDIKDPLTPPSPYSESELPLPLLEHTTEGTIDRAEEQLY